MSVVHVCPLAELQRVARRVRPSHVVTLLDPGDWPETPEGVAPERHHRVGVHDYAEPVEGMTIPEEEHVARLIDFLRGWDGGAPILIHCWAGISRSSASALVTLALHNPGREHEAAQAIRFASAIAAPNRRIVAIADRLLGLDGRLSAAAAAMAPPRLAYVNEPFEVPLNLWGD